MKNERILGTWTSQMYTSASDVGAPDAFVLDITQPFLDEIAAYRKQIAGIKNLHYLSVDGSFAPIRFSECDESMDKDQFVEQYEAGGFSADIGLRITDFSCAVRDGSVHPCGFDLAELLTCETESKDELIGAYMRTLPLQDAEVNAALQQTAYKKNAGICKLILAIASELDASLAWTALENNYITQFGSDDVQWISEQVQWISANYRELELSDVAAVAPARRPKIAL